MLQAMALQHVRQTGTGPMPQLAAPAAAAAAGGSGLAHLLPGAAGGVPLMSAGATELSSRWWVAGIEAAALPAGSVQYRAM